MHFLLKAIQPVIFCFLALHLQAQGLRGTITDQAGEPLPFAGVAVTGTSQGVAANIEGEYRLQLEPGRHRIRFQYLGYTPVDTIFEIRSSYITFNARMRPESVLLREAVVSGKGEDPAYTIMRRAIAKAKYHSMQVDEYHAMVYVKGSGRLVKTPWLFRKQINKALAEEGIDSTVAFTTESVSRLHFIRPDQYRDTVISIRTSGDDHNTSPMNFIYSSFYEPKVATCISPLAPDAFSHYRFQYLGFIEDKGQAINKIKVIPRSKGDSVFEGVIYIVDNSWSIHSLDLTTSIWGIRFRMQQQFEAVLHDVWMPAHEIYDVDGSVFGFGFEFRYFARLNDYRIKLNPDLEVPVIVLDAKVETEQAKAADAKMRQLPQDIGIKGLDPGEELSVKQLRKLMREYEKAEIEALPDYTVDTIINTGRYNQVIDSSARKSDSAYWEEIRPLPLTEREVRGYARMDSIAALPPKPEEEEDRDSITVELGLGEDGFSSVIRSRRKFKIEHLITGGRYDLSPDVYMTLRAPLQSVNFNTVDGFHAGYGLEFGNKKKRKINWKAGPQARYAFSREAVNYEVGVRLYNKGWSVSVNAGDMTRQFDYDNPMSLWSNTLYTLFVNKNYLKLYEQKFVNLSFSKSFSRMAGIQLKAEYAERERLVNHTDLIFFDDKKLLYTPNDPLHLAGGPDVFEDHTAIITDASAWIKPFWRYRVYNGMKRKDYSRSPMLTLRYRKGWGDEHHPFDFVSAAFQTKAFIGAGSQLSMNIHAGKFIGENRPVFFHDFAHFPGNRLPGAPADPVSMFRLLDYYVYSSNDQYAYGLFNYQFRRFALTQFPFFRRQGIRENIIFNTLLTKESNQYAEVGYAINYILRVMRIEFVTSWQDYKYHDFGVRVGIATNFESIFGGF